MTTSLDQQVERLRRDFGELDGLALLTAMFGEFNGRVVVTSSFGAEAVVLLDLVARADRTVPVIFLDTDALFDETIAYRDVVAARLGLADLRVVRPAPADLKAADELWRVDVDRCCHLRKVLPLAGALQGFDAVVDGRKRAHGDDRASLSTIEAGADGRVKISPLARWTALQIEQAFVARDLPRHPLVAQGYRSIGCYPCTRPTAEGESVRSGRWSGQAKTECGIHRPH